MGGLPKNRGKVVGLLNKAFLNDLNITQACIYAGINRDFYYDLIKETPGLSDSFKALRENPQIKAKFTLFKGVKRDAALALRYLKAKDPSFKEHVQHSGEIGAGAYIEQVAADSSKIVEFLAELKKRIAKDDNKVK